jgi:hypothetical protein
MINRGLGLTRHVVRLGRLVVLALSLMFLMLSSESLSEGILGGRECGDPDGYVIRHQTEFLRAERFTSEWLVPHFRKLDESVEATEHYVFSFSDEEYLANIHERRLILPGGPDPARFAGPAAHFFRIGENAFFQFEDAEGRTHRHVLEGRNVLSGEVLPGIEVIYVGQSLLYYPPLELRRKVWREHVEVPNPCEEGRRSLHLVVPGWSEESIRKLADYYDAPFQVRSLSTSAPTSGGRESLEGLSDLPVWRRWLRVFRTWLAVRRASMPTFSGFGTAMRSSIAASPGWIRRRPRLRDHCGAGLVMEPHRSGDTAAPSRSPSPSRLP